MQEIQGKLTTGLIGVIEALLLIFSVTITINAQAGPPKSHAFRQLQLGDAIVAIKNDNGVLELASQAQAKNGRYIHTFPALSVKQKQVIQLELFENGVDVYIQLIKIESPSEMKVLVERDFGLGNERETLTFSVTPGTYWIWVGTHERATPLNRYRMVARIKDTEGTDDTNRIEAEKLLDEALLTLRKSSSAIDFRKARMNLGRSLELWKRTGNGYWEDYTQRMIRSVDSKLR